MPESIRVNQCQAYLVVNDRLQSATDRLDTVDRRTTESEEWANVVAYAALNHLPCWSLEDHLRGLEFAVAFPAQIVCRQIGPRWSNLIGFAHTNSGR